MVLLNMKRVQHVAETNDSEAQGSPVDYPRAQQPVRRAMFHQKFRFSEYFGQIREGVRAASLDN